MAVLLGGGACYTDAYPYSYGYGYGREYRYYGYPAYVRSPYGYRYGYWNGTHYDHGRWVGPPVYRRGYGYYRHDYR